MWWLGLADALTTKTKNSSNCCRRLKRANSNRSRQALIVNNGIKNLQQNQSSGICLHNGAPAKQVISALIDWGQSLTLDNGNMIVPDVVRITAIKAINVK
ncbi:MAG: hypothetical protein ABII74_05140 [Elusimicrobiota bacterium]